MKSNSPHKFLVLFFHVKLKHETDGKDNKTQIQLQQEPKQQLNDFRRENKEHRQHKQQEQEEIRNENNSDIMNE